MADDRAEERSGQLAAGYARFPQAEGHDAWGDLDAWVEANARRNLAALAEEEAT